MRIIEYLEELCESLAPRDEQERLAVAAGNGLDATIKNFRRYQATAERRLDQATALLEQYRVEDARRAKDEVRAQEFDAILRSREAWRTAAAEKAAAAGAEPAAPAPAPSPAPQPQPQPVPAPAPKPFGGRPVEPESISLAELHRVRDECRERIAKAASRGV